MRITFLDSPQEIMIQQGWDGAQDPLRDSDAGNMQTPLWETLALSGIHQTLVPALAFEGRGENSFQK